MSVNYKKLWKLMIDKNLSKTELTHLAGISTNAMAKLGRNEDVREIGRASCRERVSLHV